MEFKNLHNQNDPLLICNVWDVASAKMAEQLGFQAIGTSSAAIARMLGYQDGEQISFSELSYIVKRILANTTIPLTVDLESGYSRDSLMVSTYIKELAHLGVVGINLEDSTVDAGGRRLTETESFAKLLKAVKQQLSKENINIFLNIRIDTFLLGLPDVLHETLTRIQLYTNAGADGIFLPCIENESDIETIIKSTKLPVNVMCMPALPDFDKLKAVGVKRISMGNFLFDKMYGYFEQTLHSIKTQKSFTPVFGTC